MRRGVSWIALTGILLLGVSVASAQRPQGRGGRGFGALGGPPRHPLLTWLDANKDGELSAEEIENATAVLKKLDKNGDGKLAVEELPPLPFGPPGAPNREEMLNRMRAMDKNADGKLEKAELPERMQQNFSRMDTNGDGYLDMEELKRMAERMGGGPGGPTGAGAPGGPFGGNLARRLTNFDANGDGKISKDECPERMQGMFSRLDANNDGTLDQEELKAADERVRASGETKK